MRRFVSWGLLTVALTLPLGGCSSVSDEELAEAGSEPVARTPARKRKRTKRRARAPRPKRLPPGTVQFVLEEADLKSQVLPLFLEQAGVRVVWHGDPRSVSARFYQPIAWEEALNLVCRFSRTHPTRDYQGRIVLKDGWGGELDSGNYASSGGSRGAPRPARGGGSAGGGGGGGSAGSTWSGDYGSGGQGAYSGGATARGVLKGTTTRHSGQR